MNNPFPVDQCTGYCYERFYDVNDVELPIKSGNAGTWYNKSLSSPFHKSTKLHANSVACFSGGPSGRGHVIFIEDIDSDGTISYSEANCSIHNDGEVYTTSSTSAYIKTHGSNLRFQGCIYVD